MQNAVRLRGHHLLCILCYCGEGYTPAFVENFNAVVDQIANGAVIEIVSGPDDICVTLRVDGRDTCEHAKVCPKKSVGKNDALALDAVSRTLHMPTLKAGDRLKLGRRSVTALRRAFANGEISRPCQKCPWQDFCSRIAVENFSGVRLFPK
jgi:hypothetical protein